MTIRSLKGKSPQIDPTAFVSEDAYLIGDIEIGPRASIWPGVVLRADRGKMTIGEGTNIQDGSICHSDGSMDIGAFVTLGHAVVCHARSIGGLEVELLHDANGKDHLLLLEALEGLRLQRAKKIYRT